MKKILLVEDDRAVALAVVYTLNVYIKRLREKVEDDSKNPTYIATVRGIGYKWTSKVVK